MKVDEVLRVSRALREFKLSLHELVVILCVRDYGCNDSVAMGVARGLLGISAACMSVLCRRLEEQGLVQIDGLIGDRRTKWLRLTSAGRKLRLEVQRSLA